MRRVVVVTGPAGSGAYEAVSEAAAGSGGRIKVLRAFDTMREVALEEHGLEISEQNVLNLLRERLMSIRAEAFRRIAERVESDPGVYLIRTPATFFWGGTVITGLDYSVAEALRPDAFVVVVDDVMSVRERLASDPEWSRERFTLRDLAMWRAQETALVKQLAGQLKAEFYVLARNHPPRVLRALALEPWRKKAYLSFPITHVPPEEEGRFDEERAEFVDELDSLGVVVFDPKTMTEGAILSALEAARMRGVSDPSEPVEVAVEVGGEVRRFEYPYSELEAVAPLVVGQIVVRDFDMIESADMVVVYNPLGVGSPGVACEMLYGHRVLGKRVYLIWGGRGMPSPFYTYFADARFSSKGEFLEYMRESLGPGAG